MTKKGVFRPIRTAALLAAVVSTALVPPVAAQAQAIKCTGFLHGADGSWRSFTTGTVVGSHGPVHVAAGQVFRSTDMRDGGDIARILDHVCGG